MDGRIDPRVVKVRNRHGNGECDLLSGYAVADSLVLTAAHNLDGGSLEAQAIGTTDWHAATMAWSGAPHLDAALLRVPGLPAMTGRVVWAVRTGSHQVTCRLVGFPEAAARDDRDAAEPIQGDYLPGTGVEHNEIHVNLTSATPTRDTGWRGISGAGLRDPQNQLLGVVTHVSKTYNNRIHAVPAAALLAEPAVRELLNSPVLITMDDDCELIKPAFRPLNLSSPSLSEFQLLQAPYRVVPFVDLGRRRQLDSLWEWCTADRTATVRATLLTGPAGSGKTRLAAELCQRVVNDPTAAWHAGIAAMESTGWSRYQPKRPLLAVFDYAERSIDQIRAFLRNITAQEHEGDLSVPVRVLLVSRTEGDWLPRAEPDGRLGALLEYDNRSRIRLEHQVFDDALRRAHAGAAFARFTSPDARPSETPTALTVNDSQFDTPLVVHLAALLAAKGEPLPSGGRIRDKLLTRLIDREVRQVAEEICRRTNAEPFDGQDIKDALAVIALTAPSDTEAETLLTAAPRWSAERRPLPERALMAKVLRYFHTGPTVQVRDELRNLIAAVEPDLIAEHLIANSPDRGRILETLHSNRLELRPEHYARMLNIIALAADHYLQIRKDFDTYLGASLSALIDAPDGTALNDLLHTRLTQLARSAIDQADSAGDSAAANLLATALDQRFDDVALNQAVAEAQIDIPYQNYTLARLGVALGQHKVTHFRRVNETAAIAISLHNVSNHLASTGRYNEALAAIQESVAILRDLTAEDHPTEHQANLATSLSNLGVRLADTGQHVDALATMQESVAILRDLTAEDPTEHQANLATSLNNLSIQLAGLGQVDQALSAIQEATNSYRELATFNSGRYRPELAASLNNLSNLLSETEQPEQAYAAIQEAITIRRELATINPAKYRPDLANSLSVLSNRLAETKRFNDSLTVIQEATDIRKELATANPGRYRPDLADSLHNLSIRLANTERHVDALTVIQEAIGILRDLVTMNPGRYQPDLASSLRVLSGQFTVTEQHEAALTAIQEATTIYQNLATTNPARYLPDLAGALNNLSIRFVQAQQLRQALAAIQEAIDIRRDLARKDPKNHQHRLAISLGNLSNLLNQTEQPRRALSAIQESTDIHRKLANTNPALYRPDLANSLFNLSFNLAQALQIRQALTAVQEAIDVFTQLAAVHPDRFRDRLASALKLRDLIRRLPGAS